MNYPENKDTDFSWQDFQNRTNGELADTLGNFIKRSVDFTNSRFDGVVPFSCTDDDWNVLGIDWSQTIEKLDQAYEQFHIRKPHHSVWILRDRQTAFSPNLNHGKSLKQTVRLPLKPWPSLSISAMLLR